MLLFKNEMMDEYSIIKQIGKGSYGVVWLAKSHKDKKKYVVKKMCLKNSSKRENRAAQLEVQLLASLQHPNIVSYKDSYISTDSSVYLVMSFCEGGDLYRLIRDCKGVHLDQNIIIQWFIQISMALQYIHDRNILHRDLKTQNIFLTKNKLIKLGDFGIARVLDATTDMATTLIGTPYYMSPELFTNKPYNHKSDVWALGCCLYEMTSLRHAFNARDMNSLMFKILKGKPPPMPKNYSDELIRLMKSMLSYNPTNRPTVSAILNDPFIRNSISSFLNQTKLSIKKPCKPEGTHTSCNHKSRPLPNFTTELPSKPRASSNNVIPKADSDASNSSSNHVSPTNVMPLQKNDRTTQVTTEAHHQSPQNLLPADNTVENNNEINSNMKEDISPQRQCNKLARQRRRQKVQSSDLNSGRPSSAPVNFQKSNARESKKLSEGQINVQQCESTGSSPINKQDRYQGFASKPPRPLPVLHAKVSKANKPRRQSNAHEENAAAPIQCNKSARQRRREKRQDGDIAQEQIDGMVNANAKCDDVTDLIDVLNHTLNQSSKFKIVDDSIPHPVQEDSLPFDVLKSRAADLRKECCDAIGQQMLNDALLIFYAAKDDATQQKLLQKLMGTDKFDKYVAKIWQLKFCEQMLDES